MVVDAGPNQHLNMWMKLSLHHGAETGEMRGRIGLKYLTNFVAD